MNFDCSWMAGGFGCIQLKLEDRTYGARLQIEGDEADQRDQRADAEIKRDLNVAYSSSPPGPKRQS